MGKREGRPKFLFLFFDQTEQKVIQSNSISFFGLYQIYAQSIIHSIPLKIKSTKFKPPPFASICRLLYRPSPSAKTLFNAVRQCYFEMKTNKELCFSILSIIILWCRPGLPEPPIFEISGSSSRLILAPAPTPTPSHSHSHT